MCYINELMKKLSIESSCNYYESKKMSSCKYNFTFNCSSGDTFYLGIEPNWECYSKDDRNIVLEYNPNKVNPFIEFTYLSFLKSLNLMCIRVMSFDIACDIDIPYRNVRMLKRDKREYMCDIGHSEVETRYLGSLGHNHIKLYNKALERGMQGDLTRFEITIKELNYATCTPDVLESIISLPTLYCVDNQIDIDDLSLSDVDRIVVYSILEHIDYLYTIKNYRTRKKYEKILSTLLCPIDLSVTQMCYVYNKFFEDFKDQ